MFQNFSYCTQGRIWLMQGPRLIHLRGRLSDCYEDKRKSAIEF